MSVNCTSRPPNFQNDVYTYGKIGERFFFNEHGWWFQNNGYTLYDVTNRPFWQSVDVDFVATKSGNVLIDNWECVYSKDFIKIEVKIDTRAQQTGNLPFEVVSHGNFGWSINTYADKVFFIVCKDGIVDGKLYAYTEYLIDMKRWKEFASYGNNSFRRPNCIRNEEIYDFLRDAMLH